MNKYITTLLILIFALSANAQSYQSSQIALIKGANGYYLNYPSTTIAVELLVEKEVVTPGIYARYAQKYLALRAPLVASTTYTIVDASINIADTKETTKSLIPAEREVEYSSLPVDQYSSMILSTDDAARDAAAAIFTIRKQRRDIVNGEAGEGYFGAGLKDAIEALDNMEREYLELFLGSKSIIQNTERYIFNPQEGSSRYVISRFDNKNGIIPASNLAGAPIYVQFSPMQTPDTSSIEASERSKETALIRIAAPTQCTLYNDSEEVTTNILSIYEFGKNVKVDLRK